eukprot:TRINITY_DN99549_c0_g1_i1.p1 TRINITY_DN99549_c0_g1~~TRINITY_DN99549_c0_g1_i1.p1  ORF type:complete len:104 (-),score=15.29 TRINITY_DN99549_c0_g1_i1:254-565(-)
MAKRIDLTQVSKLLPQWKVLSAPERLQRHFEFANFTQAFEFMALVAKRAEEKDHHPNWSNIYNKVSVQLYTHDIGGVTEKDIDLAAFMDAVSGQVVSVKDQNN